MPFSFPPCADLNTKNTLMSVQFDCFIVEEVHSQLEDTWEVQTFTNAEQPSDLIVLQSDAWNKPVRMTCRQTTSESKGVYRFFKRHTQRKRWDVMNYSNRGNGAHFWTVSFQRKSNCTDKMWLKLLFEEWKENLRLEMNLDTVSPPDTWLVELQTSDIFYFSTLCRLDVLK